MQPQAHVQVLRNLIDFQMLPQEALDAPRVRYVVEDHQVYLEKGIEEGIQRALATKGHDVVPFDVLTLRFGAGQLIILDPASGALLGASDPRKDGSAIGY
jgi:gamma-glutamyltranspeptidase/glutathione hydrolase